MDSMIHIRTIPLHFFSYIFIVMNSTYLSHWIYLSLRNHSTEDTVDPTMERVQLLVNRRS